MRMRKGLSCFRREQLTSAEKESNVYSYRCAARSDEERQRLQKQYMPEPKYQVKVSDTAKRPQQEYDKLDWSSGVLINMRDTSRVTNSTADFEFTITIITLH